MNEVFTEVLEGDASCLFDNCVDLFKYIEFDSSLQLHYSGLPLKLDIVKCRLGRFGAAIRKTTDQPLDRNLSKEMSEVMRDILQGIVGTFKLNYGMACRRLAMSADTHHTVCTGVITDSNSTHLRDCLNTVTEERLFKPHLIEKTPWTIYNERHAESIIGNCDSYIDELEKFFKPDASTIHQLATKELGEVTEALPLFWIQNAAQGVDSVMKGVAEQKYKEQTGFSPDRFSFDIDDSGRNRKFNRLQLGDNIVGSIGPGFKGKISIGHTYGGKGFWDV